MFMAKGHLNKTAIFMRILVFYYESFQLFGLLKHRKSRSQYRFSLKTDISQIFNDHLLFGSGDRGQSLRVGVAAT